MTFRERVREGEREGEKHQRVVASHTLPTGDLARTQARALAGSQTRNLSVGRLVLNPLSHTSQGCMPSLEKYSIHVFPILNWIVYFYVLSFIGF